MAGLFKFLADAPSPVGPSTTQGAKDRRVRLLADPSQNTPGFESDFKTRGQLVIFATEYWVRYRTLRNPVGTLVDQISRQVSLCGIVGTSCSL
jgi:hypothetical protein